MTVTKKKCILVVDDCATLRMAVQDILEDEGYQVLSATNGTHALETLRSAQDQAFPDLVLSDIAMPRMDGYALYRAIRKREEWALLPIIFVTAETKAADQAQDQYAAEYIIKPFDPEDLVALVAQHLQPLCAYDSGV